MEGSATSSIVAKNEEHEKKLGRRRRKKQYRKERQQNKVDDTLSKLNLDLDRVPDFFYPIPCLDILVGSSDEAIKTKEECLQKGNLTHLYSTLAQESFFEHSIENLEYLCDGLSIHRNNSSHEGNKTNDGLTPTSKPKTTLQNRGFRTHAETVRSCSRNLSKSFWEQIPQYCTPNAYLTADERIVNINKRYESKYYKKLLSKAVYYTHLTLTTIYSV